MPPQTQDDPSHEALRAELELARGREAAVMRALEEIARSSSSIAHEIKNTVTAVHVALRAVAGRLGADEEEVLEELVGRLRNVERSIRCALQYAQPPVPSWTELEAGRLLEEVADPLRARFDAADVVLTLAPGPRDLRFGGDAQLLAEALRNLLENALEAQGERAGSVRLEARPTEDGGVAFLCEDDGPGIPEPLRARLFDPFVTGKAEGHGLGLAIARRNALAHGGSLESVRSALGGAGFRLGVPPGPAKD